MVVDRRTDQLAGLKIQPEALPVYRTYLLQLAALCTAAIKRRTKANGDRLAIKSKVSVLMTFRC
jgi:hypothetical protein